MKNTSITGYAGLLTALTLAAVNQAGAQNLPAPVSGLQILDLAGTPQFGSDSYSASFLATTPDSTVTFVFRHDPGFFTLEDTSVTTGGGPNLFSNPNFAIGAPTAAGAGVPGWQYFFQAGNLYPEYLGYENGVGFYDGSTQAYDGIYQIIPTVPGDVYTVSFGLLNAGGGGIYQQISNNGDVTDTGGNGIDVVLYAGDALPPGNSAPDSGSTMGLMSLGLMALGGISRKLRR